MREIEHDVWVEVDLSALQHNLRQVKGLLLPGTQLMAVVKGNGYGHGYVEPARAFLNAGADALAVTRLEEGLILRDAGIDAPTLLLAPVPPGNAAAAVEARLQMTVDSLLLVEAVGSAADEQHQIAEVHVKVDTGMGRLGLLAQDVPFFMERLQRFHSLQVAGIYTHFAGAAEPSLDSARAQLAVFQQLLKRLNLERGLAHASNSAAILRLPEAQLDMVRPGTLLYGQYPSKHTPRSLELRPTWQLKARVCAVRDLPKGAPVGYGAEYVTQRPTRTAVLPVGYADGFSLAAEGPVYRQSALQFAARKYRRRPVVEISGQRAPVLGRVAMQMTIVDVTDIPGIQIGDIATVPAMRIPTNALVPRVYV